MGLYTKAGVTGGRSLAELQLKISLHGGDEMHNKAEAQPAGTGDLDRAANNIFCLVSNFFPEQNIS